MNGSTRSRIAVREWFRDLWKAMLESNVEGLTPYGRRSRNYGLARIVSTLILVTLMLVLLYYSLR